MKFAKKSLTFAGDLVLGILLSYSAQGIELQTARIRKADAVILTTKIGDQGNGGF